MNKTITITEGNNQLNTTLTPMIPTSRFKLGDVVSTHQHPYAGLPWYVVYVAGPADNDTVILSANRDGFDDIVSTQSELVAFGFTVGYSIYPY